MATSLIHAYGLFWRRDEIDWNPGAGRRRKFRLLGRNGANSNKIRVVDAREQRGIYILYGNLGAYYVGLTHASLGGRLKCHLTDNHQDSWDRFSWFGFNPIMKGYDDEGIQKLGKIAQSRAVKPSVIIKDVEALLIRAMSVTNISQMRFASADEWTQIERDQVATYMKRV